MRRDRPRVDLESAQQPVGFFCVGEKGSLRMGPRAGAERRREPAPGPPGIVVAQQKSRRVAAEVTGCEPAVDVFLPALAQKTQGAERVQEDFPSLDIAAEMRGDRRAAPCLFSQPREEIELDRG